MLLKKVQNCGSIIENKIRNPNSIIKTVALRCRKKSIYPADKKNKIAILITFAAQYKMSK